MADPVTDAALARACGVALLRSELKLGLPLSHAAPTVARIPPILAAAASGRLPARLYEVCWAIPTIDAPIGKAISGLATAARADLVRLLQRELASPWLPDPRNGPQCKAYWSAADLTLYGGAAGGGKTSLLVGLALTQHSRSVIFRRQATELGDVAEYLLKTAGSREGWNGQDKTLRLPNRLIELGHLEKPGSELAWQGGLGHDGIFFDEGAQLQKQKVQFVLGWLRSTDPTQRCRAVIASNPPTTDEGAWLVEWFAPWLDPGFPKPAIGGSLRWAVTAPNAEGDTIWVEDASPVIFEAEKAYRKATLDEIAALDERIVRPLSRTFIPSQLADNPFLANTGYRAQLQSLPEPLRTQLLTGDFLAGRKDHESQLIPTAWIDAAMARWKATPPHGAKMTAMGVDVAQGGDDQTIIACRYGGWFSHLVKKPGAECRDATQVAAAILTARRDQCPVIVDAGGGFGTDAIGLLERQGIPCTGYLGIRPSNATTREGRLKFRNRRAEDWWKLREELDPNQEHGSAIALPPDPQLRADLSSVRIKDMSLQGIQLELKSDVKKRLGRSPDAADAVVMCLTEGSRAAAKLVQSRAWRDGGRQTVANLGYERMKRGMGDGRFS